MSAQTRRNTKETLLNIYGNKCYYCEESIASHELTIDHYIPRDIQKGLKNNLRLACFICNNVKANMLPERFLLHREKLVTQFRREQFRKLLSRIYHNWKENEISL